MPRCCGLSAFSTLSFVHIYFRVAWQERRYYQYAVYPRYIRSMANWLGTATSTMLTLSKLRIPLSLAQARGPAFSRSEAQLVVFYSGVNSLRISINIGAVCISFTATSGSIPWFVFNYKWWLSTLSTSRSKLVEMKNWILWGLVSQL